MNGAAALDAGQPLPAGCCAGCSVWPALRSPARTAQKSALADAAAGSMVCAELAGWESAFRALRRGWAVPHLYAGRKPARFGGIFSDAQPVDIAAVFKNVGDFVVAVSNVRTPGEEIFYIFEKNCEKHIFICKKIGYNKETKQQKHAENRIGRNERCACANRHSLQSW